MKKLVALLLVLALVLSGCNSKEGEEETTIEDSEETKDANNEETVDGDDSLQKVLDKGVLVLGTSADYPPYEFSALIDGKDEIVGFDIELAKYIAEQLDVDLEIKDMDFKTLIGAVNSGMVDIVIAGMNPDPSRDINFSDTYYHSTHSMIVKKEDQNKYASNDEVKGIKVGTQMGSMQEKIAEELEDVEVASVTSIVNLVLEMKAGKYDGIIVETPVAESYVEANEDLAVAENVQFETEETGAAVGMKKGADALTKKVNEIIAEVLDQDLLDQWIVEANELKDEAGIE
ncbi:MAG: transporter substrate-binding domain-containing protein [Tissierellia bacterium]|nr:transporter substrate-binding domain-containing protein [Tissierellia bacterium]